MNKRISYLLAELSRMSRNGWRDATADDYQPLERELARLQARRRRQLDRRVR